MVFGFKWSITLQLLVAMVTVALELETDHTGPCFLQLRDQYRGDKFRLLVAMVSVELERK